MSHCSVFLQFHLSAVSLISNKAFQDGYLFVLVTLSFLRWLPFNTDGYHSVIGIDISYRWTHVEGIDTVSAIYGETMTVPCNDNKQLPEGVVFVKWKYVNESPYVNGQFTHTITMIPQGNDTVYCTVSNKLGQDQYTVSVSAYSRETNDQTKLIVGVVVGLIVAALVAGLIYWIYMKKSKQGSWKTGEKDRGSHEENKKLEENNHKSEA
ncbi:UNVERIFIED_CONTAM: hypothetical protein FKN15_014342 [Acipenser sinensis]